jgi:integrase
MSSGVWVTKRKGKRGVRYLVRWMEPGTGANRGKTFRRLEDARAYASQLGQDREAGSYFRPVQIGYDEWVKQHLEDLRSSPDVDLSPKTIAGQEEALKALWNACKPKAPVEITPGVIRIFRRKCLENGAAPRTINKWIATIRSALSYAVRSGILPSNKLLGPHRLSLRAETKPVRALEVGEVLSLMNAAADPHHKAAVSLVYYHGLRRGELCYLQWEDVDFDNGVLQVVDRNEHRTKTRRSRTIALRAETAESLKRLAQDRVNAWVFVNPVAFYWSCDRWFPNLCEKAGLGRCGLQNLRATCNTRMQDAGVPQTAAMQVLGHTTPQVNQRHYTGRLTRQQRAAVDALPSIG